MADLRIGAVEDGYVYVGGNPKDQKSWAPMSDPFTKRITADVNREADPTEAMGRGFADVKEGIQQFFGFPTDSKGYKEYEAKNQGIDPWRMVGNIGATAPTMLIPGGQAPGMAGLLGGLGRAGLAGGLSGGVQYVPEGGSRAANAAVGAGLGMAAQSVPAVIQGARALAAPSPTQAAAAATARGIGVNPTPAQQTGSETLQRVESAIRSQPGGALALERTNKANQRALNRAMAQRLGLDTDALDRDALGEVSRRVSRGYESALRDVNLRPDQQLERDFVRAIGQFDVPGARLPADITNRLDDIVQSGGMTGRQYQTFRSNIGNESVTAARAGDWNRAHALDAIQEVADEWASRSLPASDRILLNQARNDARILKTIEKAVNPQTGDISAPALVQSMRQKDPRSFIYGRGVNPVGDLADVAGFLKQPINPMSNAGPGALMGPSLGAAAGAAMGGPVGAGIGGLLGGTAIPYALGRAYLGMGAPGGGNFPTTKALQSGIAGYLAPELVGP